jgi:Novel toxin 15
VLEQVSGIDLSSIWQVLLDACQDMALTYGASVVAGAAVGAVGGAMAGGVGAVPGAVAGGAVGLQAATVVLNWMGLASLVAHLDEVMPDSLRHYQRGFALAWGPPSVNTRAAMWAGHGGPQADPNAAAQAFAQGHVLVVLALLSAMAAYLSKGRGDKTILLNEIRQSPRLGPKVAQWVQANEGKLTAQGSFKPKHAEQGRQGASQAQSPSQLRAGAGKGKGPDSEVRPATDDKGKDKGNVRIKPLEHKVPCFHPYDKKKFTTMEVGDQKTYLKEMAEQLKRQQDQINGMTAAEYKAAREAFASHGRNPMAEGAQAGYREKFAESVAQSIKESLQSGGMGDAQAKREAQARAKDLMSKLAALHEPDMVAGGWMQPTPKGMGRADVNASIGGSWNQEGRVAGMDKAAEDAIKSGNGNEKMNVKLEPCRGKGMK